jgi:transcriptional regulator with XRE-family HTH domain
MSQGSLAIMGSRLEHVIARNVAELRAEKDATQHDLAEMMRAHGFRWQSNRVAQIETLHRPVSLLEVVGLSRVFAVSVSRLLAGDDEIDLPSGTTMTLEAVRDGLSDQGRVGIFVRGEQRGVRTGESEREAAGRNDLRRLSASQNLDVDDFKALCHQLWGRSFWLERERRLGDVAGLSRRSAQTKRGHVTRAMLADISHYLGEDQTSKP